MTESGQSEAPRVSSPHGFDADAAVEALRARGAERFDPVGFRFIEALARRAGSHRFGAGDALDRRLEKALAEYGERFDRAEGEACDTLARGTVRFPEAADALTERGDARDFGGLRRLLAKLEGRGGSGPLAELLTHIRQHTPEEGLEGAQEGAPDAPAGAVGATAAPRSELKSLRYFRSTWSKLSLDRQLTHAFAQAPENAGPLNSHFLVLQSLKLMRDISPEYLEQFVSYVDALMWLDQADGGAKPAQKSAARGGERGKKRKSGRGSTG